MKKNRPVWTLDNYDTYTTIPPYRNLKMFPIDINNIIWDYSSVFKSERYRVPSLEWAFFENPHLFKWGDILVPKDVSCDRDEVYYVWLDNLNDISNAVARVEVCTMDYSYPGIICNTVESSLFWKDVFTIQGVWFDFEGYKISNVTQVFHKTSTNKVNKAHIATISSSDSGQVWFLYCNNVSQLSKCFEEDENGLLRFVKINMLNAAFYERHPWLRRDRMLFIDNVFYANKFRQCLK